MRKVSAEPTATTDRVAKVTFAKYVTSDIDNAVRAEPDFIPEYESISQAEFPTDLYTVTPEPYGIAVQDNTVGFNNLQVIPWHRVWSFEVSDQRTMDSINQNSEPWTGSTRGV